MSDLLKLAERCEQASGPDRELDCLIVLATADVERIPGSAADGSQDGFVDRKGVLLKGFAYTASLDAAMGLAKDFGGQVTFFKDGTATAFLWQPYPLAVEAKAATPALALTAACLRVLAAQEDHHDQG